MVLANIMRPVTLLAV